MSTNEVITPTANQSVSTSMMEAIQSVTRQGARALRNYNQPQEWKLISLRECPTPDSLQLCDTPDMAANYWRANVVTNPYFNPECETLAVLMLNTRRRVKGHCVVSIGTMDTILVHPREVFRLAVIASAHAIIIMHNHPSGEPNRHWRRPEKNSATREKAAAKSWLRPHLLAKSANGPAQAWGGGSSDDGTG